MIVCVLGGWVTACIGWSCYDVMISIGFFLEMILAERFLCLIFMMIVERRLFGVADYVGLETGWS